MLAPRTVLLFLIILIIAFALLDRGVRLPYHYAGGGVGVLVVVLVVLLVLGYI